MDGKVIIGTELDTKSFDAQIDYVESQLEEIEYKLKQADMGFEVGDTQKLEAEYEKLTIKLGNLIRKKEEFNKIDFSGVKKSINDIGQSIEKNIKKISRWALAIFGIRGAYMAVRNAINIISQDDEQLKADIDYIKTSLAYTLEPIVRGIVALVKQLLIYIGWIIKQWTGKNIFENANKSLQNTNKQAKNLNKTLAGFDEMNVLNDESSSSGGGSVLPSFDLAQGVEELEPPRWLVVIKDIGQWILDNWQDVVFTLLLIKLFIDVLTGNWIGVIIDMILLLIDGFFMIKDSVAEVWDSIQEVLGIVGDWIYEHVIKPVGDFFTGLWNGIKSGFENIWSFITKAFSKGGKIFNGLKDGIVNVFKTIVNTLITGINKIISTPFKTINNLLNTIRNVNIPVINVKPFKGLWAKNPLPVPKIPKLAKGGIINQPGRGVYTGSAIAGEAGREFYMPLQDEQMLNLVGEAIGRHVILNLTNITQLDGRQIARKVEQINQNNKFVLNR